MCGITNGDLAALFGLLKHGDHPTEQRELSQSTIDALQIVELKLSQYSLSRLIEDVPITIAVYNANDEVAGIIMQWKLGDGDPLKPIEWVFLPYRLKTTPPNMKP